MGVVIGPCFGGDKLRGLLKHLDENVMPQAP